MAYVFAALLEYAIANYLNRQRSETASKTTIIQFLYSSHAMRSLTRNRKVGFEAIFQAYFFEIQFEHQR